MEIDDKDFLKGLEEKPSFSTSDFYLSAFLLAKRYNIIATRWIDPRRLVFEFENKEGLELLVKDFMLGKTEVNSKDFINGIRNVKDIINQAKYSKGRI